MIRWIRNFFRPRGWMDSEYDMYLAAMNKPGKTGESVNPDR
jgi:hypothetical protein